jgi:tetratricopeptide (TPR) repeat protein
MLEAFQSTEGSLTMRLLAALDAAEAEGGDLRGSQSASILVVPATGDHWETVVSLRVEDHPDPVAELRRLVEIHDVYVIAGEADALVNDGRYEEAARLYVRAAQLAPDNPEIRFWAGLGAAQMGDLDRGARDVQAAIGAHSGWRELLDRLPSEVAPAARKLQDRLTPNSR